MLAVAGGRCRSSSVVDREELPAFRDAFERVSTPVDELEAGASKDVFDGAGHEHLAWLREGAHPRPNVHGETADVITAELNLARVHSDPWLEPDPGADVDECARASHGMAGNREDREHPVAVRVGDPAAVSACALGDVSLVAVDELMPTSVAHLGGARRRTHEVCEHNGRELVVGPGANIPLPIWSPCASMSRSLNLRVIP